MKNKRGFVHILLLIVIVLIGIAGISYFAYKNGQVNIPSQNTSTSPTPTASEETENWKTYTSTNLNISFKYPNDFRVLENYDRKGLFGKGIFIDYNQTGGTPERWMRITRSDKYGYWDKLISEIDKIQIGEVYVVPETKINYERQADIKLANISAFVFEDGTPSNIPGPRRLILLPNENLYYIFDITYSNSDTNTTRGLPIEYVKIFDQILSTFKFLTPDSKSVTGSAEGYRIEGDKFIIQLAAQSAKGNVTEILVWTDKNTPGNWEPFQTLVNIPLSEVEDKVYVKFRDNFGNDSITYEAYMNPQYSPPDL